MSKSTKKQTTQDASGEKVPAITALPELLKGMLMQDAFQNILARTGYGTANLMEGTQYPLTRLTRNYQLMNSLYRNNWVARRIVDLIPKDMLRQGWKYETDLMPEDITKLYKMARTTRLERSLLQGLNWGRLYGGAAGLIMVEGQEEELDQPLDIDAIMPGDFKGLLIVDRWSGVYPQIDLVSDISNPEFGLPEYYEFRSDANQTVAKVHHSRIIRFTGCDLPEWEKQAEVYWGSSVIENVYEEIKKRDNASANISGLIFLANLRIMKMSDLGELLAGTNTKAQQDFYNTMQAQNTLMSNFGIQIMSKDDDFAQFQLNNFTGLNDIYESFMLDVSGAAQIPVTKLFGRSPAGFNATGESDLRNYYDVVEGEQEAHLRPALEKLLPVICMSTLGFVPDEIEIEFNPVSTPSEKEAADLVKSKTDAVLAYHDRGIISDRTALLEAKQMSDGTGIFTNITDEDIEKASDEAGGPMLQLPENEGPEKVEEAD